MSKPPKILVTGANGFIGEHIVKQFIDDGLFPIFHARKENVPRHPYFSDLETRACDLTDLSAVKPLLKDIDVIVHCAGRTGAGHLEDPINDFNQNSLASLNLFESAKNSNIKKIICMSSYEIYGPDQIASVKESSSLNPQSPYAAAISSRDLYAQVYNRSYGMSISIFRLFNVYGWPISADNQKGLIPNLLKNCFNNKDMVITANPNDSKDFIYIDDVVSIVKNSVIDNNPGQAVNIASGKQISLRNLVETAKKITKTTGQITFEYNNVSLPSTIQADIMRLENLYPCRNMLTIDQGISEMCRKYQLEKCA